MPTDDGSMSPPDDALQQYLAARGMPLGMRRRGLAGLIAAWESLARSAAHYDLTLDDWRNDLDLRDVIAGALRVVTVHDQHGAHDSLEKADALFRTATLDVGRFLWSASGEPEKDGMHTSSWWYRRRPAYPGDTMRADLEAAGLLRASE